MPEKEKPPAMRVDDYSCKIIDKKCTKMYKLKLILQVYADTIVKYM